MTSRRQFLQSALLASFAAGCARPRVVASPSPPPPPRAPVIAPRPPRYAVSIILWGGYDSVLTFDPKDASAVGDKIDCGYTAAERIRGRDRLYGPLLGGLIRHESDLCLVHGCRVDTVAHPVGLDQLLTGHFRDGSPATLSSLAQTLPGDAPSDALIAYTGAGAGSVQDALDVERAITVDPYTLRSLFSATRPSYAAPPFFDEIAAAQQAQARRVFARYPGRREQTEGTLREAATVHAWLDGVPSKSRMRDPTLGPAFDAVLSSIRQNRAKCHFVIAPEVYLDSHTDNYRIQKQRLTPALDDLATFIDVLKTERNAFGTLFDQTTIAVTSEVGRFPKLNSASGKDHWPENTWLLIGRGIARGATIGATDERLRGATVDFRTGLTKGAERRWIYADNFFATFVKASGGDLNACGFKESDVIEAACAT